MQQLTGINAIIYSADKVFRGRGVSHACGADLGDDVVTVLYVDRLGRRPLLLWGLLGMCWSPLTVGICFLHLGHLATGWPRRALDI